MSLLLPLVSCGERRIGCHASLAHIVRIALLAGGLGIAPAALAAPQQFVDQTATRFPGGLGGLLEYTNQLSLADVDGDGDLDIAFANGGGWPSAGPDQQVRLLINNGAGVFADESMARIGVLLGDFRGVEFGDVDRDGDWDMALANDNNALPALLINNGSGVFSNQTATRLPSLTLGSSRVQFADVDNDGDLDLYFTNGTTSRFGTGRGKLYLNDGSGVFTDATATHTPNQTVAEPQDCIFGDVDGDFDLDLRIASTGANQSKLYLNNGAGVFAPAPVAPPADANCYSYDFGDMNGDGDLDLIGANASGSGNNAELLLDNADGLGTFVNVSANYSPNPTVDDNDSKFFDYDNDGDLDLFIARLGGTAERIYNNNGAGVFTEVAGLITPITDSTLDIKVADVDGDGRYDIITGQGESGSYLNRIYMNLTGPVDNRPPTIVRTEQQADVNGTGAGPFTVRTVIVDAHSSDRGFHDKGVTLNWRNLPTRGGRGGSPDFSAVPMHWSGNSLWRGVIPAQSASGTIEYFVTARDFANNLATGPTLSFDLTLPCPADTNGSGAVDVDDLIAVILGWGCVSPPSTCAGDVNGSGTVDVDDLIAVILGWGACP